MAEFNRTSILFLISIFGIIASQYIGSLVFDPSVGQLVMPVVFTLICGFTAIYSVSTIKYIGSVKAYMIEKTGAKRILLTILAAGLFYFLYPVWNIIIYFATILFFGFVKTWYMGAIEKTNLRREGGRDKITCALCLSSAANFIYCMLWFGVFWQIYIYNPGNWSMGQTSLIAGVLLVVSFILFFREFKRAMGWDAEYIMKYTARC